MRRERLLINVLLGNLMKMNILAIRKYTGKKRISVDLAAIRNEECTNYIN